MRHWHFPSSRSAPRAPKSHAGAPLTRDTATTGATKMPLARASGPQGGVNVVPSRNHRGRPQVERPTDTRVKGKPEATGVRDEVPKGRIGTIRPRSVYTHTDRSAVRVHPNGGDAPSGNPAFEAPEDRGVTEIAVGPALNFGAKLRTTIARDIGPVAGDPPPPGPPTELLGELTPGAAQPDTPRVLTKMKSPYPCQLCAMRAGGDASRCLRRGCDRARRGARGEGVAPLWFLAPRVPLLPPGTTTSQWAAPSSHSGRKRSVTQLREVWC